MMRALVLILAAISFNCSPPVAGAQVSRVMPVDEADRDPSFFLFRARLIDAVVARDTTFVYDHLSPDIRTSFGAGGGPADFKRMWRPSDPDSELWPVLGRVLARGGTFSEDPATGDSLHRFTAPYTFSTFPDDVDAFTHQIVLGESVLVRAQPDAASEVLDTLSYDVVETPEYAGPEAEWIGVQLEDGQSGFVAADYLASSFDYRAAFEKRDGRWVMTFFVAGD